MDDVLTTYGRYMDDRLTMYGRYMDDIRTIYGRYMDDVWTIYDDVWTVYGRRLPILTDIKKGPWPIMAPERTQALWRSCFRYRGRKKFVTVLV